MFIVLSWKVIVGSSAFVLPQWCFDAAWHKEDIRQG